MYDCIFFRRDPYRREVGTNPEKIAVINDNDNSSKLVVKNLQSNDSGSYVLVADNGVRSERISVNLLVKGNY